MVTVVALPQNAMRLGGRGVKHRYSAHFTGSGQKLLYLRCTNGTFPYKQMVNTTNRSRSINRAPLDD
jgi:predicted DNA-binding transcriptional regulator AlpA